MNIAVDFGNTIAKVGIFKDDILEQQFFFTGEQELKDFLANTATENLVVSSVRVASQEILSWSGARGKKIALSSATPLPIKILYRTPDTLGVDRIAAVCGAFGLYPAQNCVVIDAGTCITFEFLDDEGNYHGGSISPGIKMRFQAMHQFTARLPLAQPTAVADLIGNSTEACLQSGVINGVKAEIAGIIAQYRSRYRDLRIVVCGGDAAFFENTSAGAIAVQPSLVLNGLNRILRHSM